MGETTTGTQYVEVELKNGDREHYAALVRFKSSKWVVGFAIKSGEDKDVEESSDVEFNTVNILDIDSVMRIQPRRTDTKDNEATIYRGGESLDQVSESVEQYQNVAERVLGLK